MLRYLHLKNLVLIDSCKISFEEGFSILSGETGAGKTALIEAISLALGQRADTTVIRKGEEKAFVEAAFSIENLPHVRFLLEEAGVDFDKEELLIIRREIFKEGKNRALINHQVVPLPLLQNIGSHLVDLAGQHSSSLLKSQESHRSLLDLFAGLESTLDDFQKNWEMEKLSRQKKEELIKEKSFKEKDFERLQKDLEHLKQINFHEEEALFQEYDLLQHTNELQEKTSQILGILSESPESILPLLHRAKNSLESLLSLDPRLQESATLLQESYLSLQEASHCLSKHFHHLENHPQRLQFLEERLSEISRLKRKFGPTIEEIEAQKGKLEQTFDKWENLDLDFEKEEKILKELEQKTQKLCSEISFKRKASAKKLEALLTCSLQSLNMEGAEIQIEITPSQRTSMGEDSVNFLLKANKGENFAPVKTSASGGELSRLLFAIKTTLAEKNKTSTLIFDEIDANMGGETAAIIGEKLQSLAKCRQVLCITHFPQVACKTDQHFRIYKEEEEGRTFTRIESLDSKERQKELLRMLGGKKEAILQKI